MNTATGMLCLCLFTVSMAGLSDKATAQETRLPLSYADAQARLLDRSDAIDAADAAVRAAEARMEATRTLGRPEVEVEAQVLDFQKTLYLPLGSLEPVANAFGITDPLRFRIRRFVSRPIVTATVPIYAGGKMGAARAGATSRVAIEVANLDEASQQALAQLARAYFGRQLAAQALAIRQDVAEGIRAHVADARALEREQQIAPAQRLQAEAQLEQALREAEKPARIWLRQILRLRDCCALPRRLSPPRCLLCMKARCHRAKRSSRQRWTIIPVSTVSKPMSGWRARGSPPNRRNCDRRSMASRSITLIARTHW